MEIIVEIQGKAYMNDTQYCFSIPGRRLIRPVYPGKGGPSTTNSRIAEMSKVTNTSVGDEESSIFTCSWVFFKLWSCNLNVTQYRVIFSGTVQRPHSLSPDHFTMIYDGCVCVCVWGGSLEITD